MTDKVFFKYYIRQIGSTCWLVDVMSGDQYLGVISLTSQAQVDRLIHNARAVGEVVEQEKKGINNVG